MVKKSATKAPKISGAMPEYMSSPRKPTAEDKAREKRYQLEDDGRTIKNYLSLKKDSGRHNAAIADMKSQADELDTLTPNKRAMPNKSRKLGRKASRGGRRSR